MKKFFRLKRKQIDIESEVEVFELQLSTSKFYA